MLLGLRRQQHLVIHRDIYGLPRLSVELDAVMLVLSQSYSTLVHLRLSDLPRSSSPLTALGNLSYYSALKTLQLSDVPLGTGRRRSPTCLSTWILMRATHRCGRGCGMGGMGGLPLRGERAGPGGGALRFGFELEGVP